MRLDRFVPFLGPLGFLSGPLVRLTGAAAAASGAGDSEGAIGPCRCWFTGPSLVIWTGVGCTTRKQNGQHMNMRAKLMLSGAECNNNKATTACKGDKTTEVNSIQRMWCKASALLFGAGLCRLSMTRRQPDEQCNKHVKPQCRPCSKLACRVTYRIELAVNGSCNSLINTWHSLFGSVHQLLQLLHGVPACHTDHSNHAVL